MVERSGPRVSRRAFAAPGLSLQTRRALYGYLFLAPWFVGFLVFLAWPLFFSFWISFREIKELTNLGTEYVGLDNYRQAFFVDVNFLPAFGQTLGDLFVDMPITIVFSLSIALLVTQPIRGSQVFRVLFFMPVVVGSAYVIRQLFSQEVGRLAIVSDVSDLRALLSNYLGEGALLPLFDLINRISFVLWGSGVQIVIFIAGLQSVPPSLYEAARVDGGSDWGIFWKVTLPLISPIILVNIIYTIVDSFTDPFNRVVTYIQQVALIRGVRLGYGAALGWVYFVAIFAILTLVLIWSTRFVYYAGERS